MMGNWAMNEEVDWILYIVLSILVVAGFVLLMIWAVRRLGRSKWAKAEESALEILKKRYASGEITKEEYEEKKREIP